MKGIQRRSNVEMNEMLFIYNHKNRSLHLASSSLIAFYLSFWYYNYFELLSAVQTSYLNNKEK